MKKLFLGLELSKKMVYMKGGVQTEYDSTGIICKDSVLDGDFVVDDHEVGEGAGPGVIPAAGPGMSSAAGPGMSSAAVPGPGPVAGSDPGFGVDAVAGPGVETIPIKGK